MKAIIFTSQDYDSTRIEQVLMRAKKFEVHKLQAQFETRMKYLRAAMILKRNAEGIKSMRVSDAQFAKYLKTKDYPSTFPEYLIKEEGFKKLEFQDHYI